MCRTNVQFDAARAAGQGLGFLNTTSAAEADYNTTVNSWIEQRRFVTNAPKVLSASNPKLAASLDSAFAAMQNVSAPSAAHLAPVADPATATFVCAGHTVGFDGRGAVTTMTTPDGTDWASAANPVGLYQYHTFDNEDYNLFLQDFASRVDGPGCGGYGPGSPDDSNCKNFRKPNVSSADPKRRVLFPTLSHLFHGTTAGGGCEFVVEMVLDPEAHALAGAPNRVVAAVSVSARAVAWDMVQIGKRPTRLPEAGFFSFNPVPAAAAPTGWRVQVLGSELSPTDVLGAGPGGANINASTYGGSPHLLGVEAATWSPPASAATTLFAINLTSLDVPIACAGAATPYGHDDIVLGHFSRIA